ncbi:tetratricopeptide repeat protein [Streptomyces sp. CB03911]|uniref:tetratricopeptide repeat protein n=1 Tax=Streptomyces sp. CB03911 TaxID=1804758 RepID=UPI0009393846|nr:tetratricopeptide repeat protein [Streptomyces sp. CB03911]OKI29193.1 hypothetical protein A6A07_23710 [Streptomyces sp. CB03911]
MNVDDLQWQSSHLAGVPPRLVDELLEHGCLQLVVAAAREREDWFCAAGAVRELCGAGEFGRAWAVVDPFTESGWQPAVRTGADVLLRWGRVEEALALARPTGPWEDADEAWRDYATMLVRVGRVEEAIDVLGPHLRAGRVLQALVEMTEDQGCDERVLELLAPIAEEFRRDPGQCGARDLWEVLPAQARVLERSGRTDEAIRLFGTDVATRRYGPQNNVEFYAGLLARHGRIGELRELATGTGAEQSTAVRPYVRVLEALGQADEAEAYLRGLVGAADHPSRYENELLELLVRQGRFDDAVQAVEHTFDDLYEGNLLQPAMILLAEQGRHDQALSLTEGRSTEFLAENDAFWLRSNRWWLMGESGRAREAIVEIEALPAGEVDDREVTIAWLLAQDGRVEEAVARLLPLPGRRAANDLAELLMRQGRFTEAITVIPDTAAQREEERGFRTPRTEQQEAAPSDTGRSSPPHPSAPAPGGDRNGRPGPLL